MFKKVNFFVVNNIHFSKRIMNRKNLKWIPNGFFPVKFNKKKEKKFTLIFVGYLSKMKNVEFIIKAMKNLNSCKLYVIGDIKGEYRKEYLRLINNYDVSNIIFTGKIQAKEVSTYLEKGDIFVSSSLREGFPNSVLEAMFHGLPVVCKNIDAMNTIIRNGENGFLFNNEEEYIKIIKLLKKDKKLRESISNLALKEAYKRYQINKIAKEYLKIYKKLLFVPKQP